MFHPRFTSLDAGSSGAATTRAIVELAGRENVRSVRLQVTDLTGRCKSVEIPSSQLEKGLDGRIVFDGSSVLGPSGADATAMSLVPDLATFRVEPWVRPDGSRVGRVISDVYLADGTPFAGCPRLNLKRQVECAEKMGYTVRAGPETEFFLFRKDSAGRVTTIHDDGDSFDVAPTDRGETCRRDMVAALEALGFEIEAAHHEGASGSHEIDFKYSDAVSAADNVQTVRFVVRKVAGLHGLHASFAPKPLFGDDGAGLHVHQSLFRHGVNAFFDAEARWQLSEVALGYVAGILHHAAAMAAVTNPVVSSYKRLVPGAGAPVGVAWSETNRSSLVRVPVRRGVATHCEVRLPDAACNPYLALAVMLAAGLDGVARGLDPGPPVNRNVFTLSAREKLQLKIRQLPASLRDALDQLEDDPIVLEALGGLISHCYVGVKRRECNEDASAIRDWELRRYFGRH